MIDDQYFNSLPTGWSGRETVEMLHDAAKSIGPGGVILEIGAYVGRSAVNMARALDNQVQIVSVDPLPDDMSVLGRAPKGCHGAEKWMGNATPHEHFLAFTKGYPVTLVRKPYPTELDIKADMVYWDATREYDQVMSQLTYAYNNHMNPSAFMCGSHYVEGYGSELIRGLKAFSEATSGKLQSCSVGFWTIRW